MFVLINQIFCLTYRTLIVSGGKMCYTWVNKLTGKSESEGLNYMNISLIDEYVYLVLLDNSWTEKRDFLLADSWIEKIEQESSISCFEYARKILHLFGGMKFRDFSPKSGQYFLGKCNGEVNRLEKWYLHPLERLNHLSERKSIGTYTGATFTFDAWATFLNFEIVIDLKTAEQVIGEKLFPIGTVEPDGITCAAESGNIYTLFDDSIFLSGDCIENYLNMLFIYERTPKRLM